MYFAPSGSPLPTIVAAVAADRSIDVASASSSEEAAALAGRPPAAAVVVVWPDRCAAEWAVRSTAASAEVEAEALCRKLKGDPFTATVPLIVLAQGSAGGSEGSAGAGIVAAALDAGADEALATDLPRREKLLRLKGALRRSERDLAVHPATRLPGAPAVERRLAEQIATGSAFALCHADLDRFKEYNDRYGWAEGDKAILLVAAILREVAGAVEPAGFVGHLGGDDFAFLVTPEQVGPCCDQIVTAFGALAPLRYDHADRVAGGFAAPDRRGSVRRLPVMSLSIGAAVGAAGAFASPSQARALAAKMKDRAKESPGNAWLAGRHDPNGLSYFSSSLMGLRVPVPTRCENRANRHGNRSREVSSLRPPASRRPRGADRGATGVPLTSTGERGASKS